MTDYRELKRLAEAAKRDQHDYAALNDYKMAMPPAVALDLIAENETIKDQFGECARLFVDATEQACKAKRERDQLKAENEALKCAQQHYDCAIEGLMHEAKALRKAANELRRFATCEHMHHDKPDWHEYDEPCKVLVRIDVVLSHGDK